MDFNKPGYPSIADNCCNVISDEQQQQLEQQDNDRDEELPSHPGWDETENKRMLKGVLLDIRSVYSQYKKQRLNSIHVKMQLHSLLTMVSLNLEKNYVLDQCLMNVFFDGDDPVGWVFECLKFVNNLLKMAEKSEK